MSVRQLRSLTIAVCLVAGCTGRPAYLGPRDTGQYDPNDRIDYAVTECGGQLLLFIPFFNNNKVERAMKLVEARASDRYIANVRIRERWMYLVFGSIYCTDVIAATYGSSGAQNRKPTRIMSSEP
jgi:hypothetical protein